MEYVLIYIIAFLIVYFFYLVTVVFQSKKSDKFKKSNQVLYFVKRYKINMNKINFKSFVNVLALTNSLIISTAFMATFLVKNLILQLLIGFLLLIPLILFSYHLIGKHYKKKEI